MVNQKNIIKELEKKNVELKFLRSFLFFNMLLLIGVLCNVVVIFSNDYKMPVHNGCSYCYTDSKHFTFTDFNSVKYPLLSDIFYIKVSQGRYYIVSIGDILMFLGIIGMFVSNIYIIVKLFKQRDEKNGK